MRLREALKTGLNTLVENRVPSPQLAAELLLMHVVGCDRGYLYAHPEVELPGPAANRYFLLIAERSTGKPTQYITGHQEFWGLDLEVTPDVLIPRPETEHVVEAVLDLARRNGLGREAPLRMVDVAQAPAASPCRWPQNFRAPRFGRRIFRGPRSPSRRGMPRGWEWPGG